MVIGNDRYRVLHSISMIRNCDAQSAESTLIKVSLRPFGPVIGLDDPDCVYCVLGACVSH